jgi:hypothetical protein
MDHRTRTFQLAALAVALLLAGCARTREPTSNPEAAATPPPTFLEAEPGNTTPRDRLTVVVTDGLVISMHATPVSLAEGGWGFELELEYRNQLLTQGVFDLGPEPVVVFTISVTLPDGSGFGSGGGCTFGSSLHGYKEQALGPGQRRVARESWMAGVDSEQVLEASIGLCSVRLPDGRTLGGQIARLDAVVDAEGKLVKFELSAVPVPQP